MLLVLTLLACPATDDSAKTTDTAADTDTGTAGVCSELSSATDWYWNGECPQMITPCDIVVDGCTLTIDYEADGGMTMGMPYEATIEGGTITFADGDGPTGCVGTIVSPDEVTGTCDGCEFTLQRDL